jgi:hypothetical protein
MLASLFGFFLSMVTVLTAAVVLLTSFPNVSTMVTERNHLRRPVIGQTVRVEIQRQRHSEVAKQEVPAKDVTQVVASAKPDTKKIKRYKPKVFARQPGNYGSGHALGYAAESGYNPQGPFFQ